LASRSAGLDSRLMSQCHKRRDRKDTLIRTNGVEPGRTYDPRDADKSKTDIAWCETLVQDGDLRLDLRVWNVTTLHSAVFGDDVD
jgi:hypothetical protein